MTLVGLTRVFVVLVATILAGVSAMRRGSSPAIYNAQYATSRDSQLAPSRVRQPPGSHSVHAFVNDDTQLYLVNGCSAPGRLTNHDATTTIRPLTLSPVNHWLMGAKGPTQITDSGPSTVCQAHMNPQIGAMTPTTVCEDSSLSRPSCANDTFCRLARREYIPLSGLCRTEQGHVSPAFKRGTHGPSIATPHHPMTAALP
jgi:hypothetical protein